MASVLSQAAVHVTPARHLPPASGPTPAHGSAPISDATPVRQTTKEEQAVEAWNAIAKPVNQESFVAWYCQTHNKKTVKRPAESQTGASAKRQATLPGAPPVPQAAAAAIKGLPASKKKALLKGMVTVLKKSIKAERWHMGDYKTVTGSSACTPEEFPSLFTGVELKSSGGAVTSFEMDQAQLKSLFGDMIEKLKSPTWSRPRSFSKSYKTGSQDISIDSAEGKYSKNTSMITVKFKASCGGGGGCGYGGFGFGDY